MPVDCAIPYVYKLLNHFFVVQFLCSITFCGSAVVIRSVSLRGKANERPHKTINGDAAPVSPIALVPSAGVHLSHL